VKIYEGYFYSQLFACFTLVKIESKSWIINKDLYLFLGKCHVYLDKFLSQKVFKKQAAKIDTDTVCAIGFF